MKTIAFTLSMPNRGSWNGRWSGENTLYCVTRRYRDERADEILKQHSYDYRWSDGWGAGVAVAAVDATQARKLKSKSKGFCGYEWMIDSIERHGKIYADHEAPKAPSVSEETKSASASS